MASPNTNYTDIITSTLEYRGDSVADAVTKNNAGLAWMKAHGGYKVIDGGHKIVEPIQFAENSNAGWYTGYDTLTTGAQEILSGAEFTWKQLAVPVVSSGLELEVQNSGKEAVFDLLEEKIKNAERTAANVVSAGFFSDGTGTAGKQLTGLLAMCSATPTTGIYGGINRATASNAWWRNKFTDTGADPSSATILGIMNTMWYSLVRGSDKPNVLIGDSNVAGAYEAALQANQRFTDPKMAELGFENLKYKSATFVMDGNCTTKGLFFLNTDFMRLRVAKNRNFKPLKSRDSFNQDASVVILAAALNLTCSNAIVQGRIEFAA